MLPKIGRELNTPCIKTIFFSGVILSILTCCSIKWLTTPPPLPTMDLKHHWGTPYTKPENSTIKPFYIEFTTMMTGDLNERLLHLRLPPPPIDAGFAFGFNTHFLKKLVDFWRNKYNFKERETFLNKYKHYKIKIQGLDIHFMRVKPEKDDVKVVPLLLLHGWPSSVREFYEMIPELMKQRENQNYVFEIIAPSLPGFGFSQSTQRSGLGILETSIIMNNLMNSIGHKYYYIHGGRSVAVTMATLFPNNVRGFHAVSPIVNHAAAHVYVWFGSFLPSLIEVKELRSLLYPLKSLYTLFEDTGACHMEVTKPDTIGAALSDSPAGLAAYILDRFTLSNPKNTEAYDGRLPEVYSLTKLLDNIMIYWITNSITTGMRVYKETWKSKVDYYSYIDSIPTTVPTCGIKFKHSQLYQPDSVLKMKYINYLRTTIVADGGMYPAYETPDILANDLVEAVDLLLEFNQQKGEPPEIPEPAPTPPQTIYDFTANDIHGNPVNLSKYKGKLVIIVNVASRCSQADINYKEFNRIYDLYHNKGLRILAFPCNQFNNSEPGTAEDILKFAKEKKVNFDLFEKIDVNGDNAHPLFKYLKYTMGGTLGDFIPWNFSKFIVNKNGIPIERVNPPHTNLETYVWKYL